MTDVKLTSPTEAWEIITNQPQSVLVDVRSSMEYLFVGHPKGAISVPWIDEPDWIVDPHFTSHIRQLLLGGVSNNENESVPILLICRSGKRSLDAANLLIKEGFSGVHNIEDGFEGPLNDSHQRSSISGWRHDNLPWEQS